MAKMDRAFASATGLGTAIGTWLGLILLLPLASGFPFALILLPYALVVALPMATVRFPRNRIEWLGIRYCLAACGSTFLGLLFALLIEVSLRGKGGSGIAAFVGFLALTGILAGWFAFCSQRWAAREVRMPLPTSFSSNLGDWGAAGLLGVTIFLLSAAILGGLAAPFPSLGPAGIEGFFARLAAGILLLFGFVGLIFEASRPWVRRLAE